jgi:antitoxin (DNA-binding transcriptional repressor) of toxin-antitoxin stability system
LPSWEEEILSRTAIAQEAHPEEEEAIMQTLTVEEAQSHLADVIEKLQPGEEVILTRNDKPVATLRAIPPSTSPKQRQLGTLRGTVLSMAPDFDAIPEGFEEYVE